MIEQTCLYEMEEKEMNKKKGIITAIVAMAMFCMTSISAFAATTSVENKLIYLPENQKWSNNDTMSRSGCNNFVSASLSSVYPESGNDSYTRIQVRILSPSGYDIMDGVDYVVLHEGQGYQPITIRNGWLFLENVRIQFRGNKNDDAYAIVSYKGE